MEPEIFFDNNATTRPLPEVCQAVTDAMGAAFGNPSSDHAAGHRARRTLAQARGYLADLLGCRPEQFIFTGSGTEANNLVLLSAAAGRRACRIVSTPVEHSSVLKTLDALRQKGAEIVLIPVDAAGRLDLQGIRCSQTSACTSARPEPSYVLRAMGLSEQDAYASIRFSFGVFNTEDEIEILKN